MVRSGLESPLQKVFYNQFENILQLKKTIIWFLVVIGFITCIYDTYYWIFGKSYNRWISAFLYPGTRLIWTLITSATIWMCISGNGGFINQFYSWKAFIPLSRLTYSVYLTHVWIDWYYWGSKRDLIDLNNFTHLILIICGILFISYIIGAIFSILFESPFFVLQKCFRDYFLNIQKSRIIYKSHNNNLNQKEIKNFIDETNQKFESRNS